MKNIQVRNEKIINAPAGSIWTVITNINMLPKIMPGVVSATGRMDKEGETRICELNNGGRKGKVTEKLIELVPEKKTVWKLVDDTMGMGKLLKDTEFVFILEKQDENKTKLISESHYRPGNFIAKVLSAVVLKKMMSKTQDKILNNISQIVEK